MAILNDLKKWFLKSRLGVLLQNTVLRRTLLALGFFLVLTFTIAVDFMPERVALDAGQVSPRDFRSPRSIDYIDEIETERLRKEATEKVEPSFQRDPNANEVVNSRVSEFINKVREIKNVDQREGIEEITLEEKAVLLGEELPFEISQGVLLALIKADESTLVTLENRTKEIFTEAYRVGIDNNALESRKNQLVEEARKLQFKQEYEQVVTLLIREYTIPNRIYDEEETQRRIAEAQSRIVPVQKSLKQGEIILREGEIVTREHLVKLQALGLLKPSSPYGSVVGIGILVGIGMVLTLAYIYQRRRDIYHNEAFLLLLGIIVTIILLLTKVVIAINIAGRPDYSELVAYAAPLAAASMLIAILLDARLSIVVTVVMSLLLGIMTGGQLKFTVVGLVTGIVGVYSVSRLSQRTDLAKAGLIVGVAGLVTITSMGLISNTPFSVTFFSAFFLGLINGILASILTIGSLPYLETAFGITSSIRLLELSNPNNPLLKKLLVEAPGTYHHSIIVGNLAESAAEAIGADSLLARVGAHYHDIGKIKRPYFFIENQLTSENPHDRIAPTLSTLIITSHIKDGLEFADQHKLPTVIRDIIEQHHGSTLCSFFYLKAKGDCGEETILNEDDFRYDSPKPQTKEAAIVMLADSVEAAVRSLQKPNLGRIEGLVRKIVKEKLHDGQLDESDLTLKEIDKIAEAFMTVLGGIFHSRIEYPDQIEKEIERRKTRVDSSNNKPTGKNKS